MFVGNANNHATCWVSGMNRRTETWLKDLASRYKRGSAAAAVTAAWKY
jgi:hypothetical protein